MTRFLVITGLSGAGRSQAANAVEDLGWYVIDNLPLDLIPQAVELAREKLGRSQVAFALPPSTEPDALPGAIIDLKRTVDGVEVLFLDAATDVLVHRYESTRRRHPYGVSATLGEAIEAERVALTEVRAEADVVIDTSELNVHELRARMDELFGPDRPADRMRLTVVSFGYRHGLPRDVDAVFDCRFLPNPHWVPELRPLTGLDPAVSDYVMGQDITKGFLDRVDDLLQLLVPAYIAEGKSYLTIAFGCTGGRHRSVAIAERVGDLLGEDGYDPIVVHRDVDR